MAKTYHLELTAEEVEAWANRVGNKMPIAVKLDALAEQARADRERDELRLPWRVCEQMGDHYVVFSGDADYRPAYPKSAQVANLMSAAPELLEALKAVMQWADDTDADCQPSWSEDVRPYINRALKKVRTGVPEGE
jgi:hypothetical protein